MNFDDRFSENSQIPNFMKIRPVEAQLFHADGRTDRHDEANTRYSQFCENA
jgi:hypothetical protein